MVLQCHRLPLISQSFLGICLLLSEYNEGAATLNQVGFSTCLALPLTGSIPKFKELLRERDVQNATIEDVVASKERSMDGQDVFEAYLTALSVECNVMRNYRFRFDDALKFVGSQISCIPEARRKITSLIR